jgi:predicted transcriptional regulator
VLEQLWGIMLYTRDTVGRGRKGMAMAKTMTLRLSDEQAANLEAMARVEGMPVSEAVRVAIDERIKARRGDKEFQTRIKRMLEEEREVLKRLAG